MRVAVIMSQAKRARFEIYGELPFVKMSSNATAPVRSSPEAAGFDLFAAEEVSIAPGSRACVATDLQVAVPVGCYGRIAPRSGLAVKHGLDVGAGVVDADFRGNVKILLFNFGTEAFTVHLGDRIAQLILEKIYYANAIEKHSLERK